ncbi:MAG TPA: hypothetical protein VNC60_07595 [Actinomycetota bacterium]|nr:hypothetical protein [Actinomycetota bacterium]
MGANRHDEGDELERLLEGSAEAREQLPELAIFVDDLLEMPAPSPGAEDLHVAAMMSESSHLLADKGDPVARPVSNAHGPAMQVSGLPMRRSTPMVKLLLAKVMAPLVAVFTLMGGLAYAQVLPDPLQDAVAGAGGVVGLDLPDSDGSDLQETDDDATEVEVEDPLDKAEAEEDDANETDADEEDEADEPDNSGPGNGDEEESDHDSSDPGAGDDDSDDDSNGDADNSGPGGGGSDDDSDNSGPGGGGSDDDSDNSGPGGGGGSDDDSSGSGQDDGTSDVETEEVESED